MLFAVACLSAVSFAPAVRAGRALAAAVGVADAILLASVVLTAVTLLGLKISGHVTICLLLAVIVAPWSPRAPVLFCSAAVCCRGLGCGRRCTARRRWRRHGCWVACSCGPTARWDSGARGGAMRWVVVGAGSIGAGLGGALARVGEDVHLVARGPHLDALREHGLRWRTPTSDLHLPIRASALTEVEPTDDDVVCLATKLQDAQGALQAVRDRWGDVPVVTWTNGLDGHRWASRWATTVVATVQFIPASVPAPGQVCVWGTPYLGALHAGTVQGDDGVRAALVEALQPTDFDAVAHDDLAPIQNAKWMRNLAGAVQALCVPEAFPGLTDAVIAEGVAVLEALGWPVAPFDALVGRPLGMGTIDGAARGGGSTWQSLHSGRPLESRWLNGALVELAESHGLSAPLNAALTEAAARATAESWRTGQLTADHFAG